MSPFCLVMPNKVLKEFEDRSITYSNVIFLEPQDVSVISVFEMGTR
jgi:hypothetical protein